MKNLANIPKRLAKLPNLAEFARSSNLPLRTLVRLKNDGIGSARMSTLLAVAEALAPKKKGRAQP